jgi:hypothetical protein
METITTETRFPEILKFCAWFKKEQEEKGLYYLHLPVYVPSSNLGFGRSVFFTPQLVSCLEKVIDSDRNIDFSDLEKVCAEFNRLEELIAQGEVLESPPSVSQSNGLNGSVLKIIEGVRIP